MANKKQEALKLSIVAQSYGGNISSGKPFFSAKCDADGRPEGMLPLGLAKALGCYIRMIFENSLDADQSRNLETNLGSNTGIASVGTKTVKDGKEDLYVEYSENEDKDIIQCVRISSDGKMSAINYSKAGGGYTQGIKSKEDCAGPWLALLCATIIKISEDTNYMVESGALDASILEIKNALVSNPNSNYIVELTEEVMTTVLETIKKVEEKAYKEFEKTSITLLSSTELLNGNLGPADGKLIFGEPFRAMGVASNPNIEKTIKCDTKKYNAIPWENTNLSPEDKALIPADSDRHIISTLEIEILDEFERTSRKTPDMRLTNILLSGNAGTGKSETARFLASPKALNRPFVTQTCDADMTKDDLLGCLMPVVDNDAKSLENLNAAETSVYLALKNTEGGSRNSAIDAGAEALGYPTIGECFLDPVGSWEAITGKQNEDVDPASCVERLDAIVSEVLSTAVEKLSQGGDKAVSYRYIPSPTIEAIKNGYVLELQEPTNVKNQGIFSCLYDVLEKASIGTVQTPLGRIKRHPDFVCIMTTNTQYTGNKPLSPAFESRFSFNRDIANLDTPTLIKRVKAKVGKDVAQKHLTLISYAVDVFEKAKEKGAELSVRGDLTPRALYAFVDAICDGVKAETAFRNYILHHLSHEEEDKDEIWEAVSDHDLFNKAQSA